MVCVSGYDMSSHRLTQPVRNRAAAEYLHAIFYSQLWPRLGRGKHKNKSLGQVVFADPDWFYWSLEQSVYHGDEALAAEELGRRARRIRIRGDLVADYVADELGRFVELQLVPPAWPSSSLRLGHIDLSVPRAFAEFDKTGNKILINAVKGHLFGDPCYRMTRGRCRDFFMDPANFCLE